MVRPDGGGGGGGGGGRGRRRRGGGPSAAAQAGEEVDVLVRQPVEAEAGRRVGHLPPQGLHFRHCRGVLVVRATSPSSLSIPRSIETLIDSLGSKWISPFFPPDRFRIRRFISVSFNYFVESMVIGFVS